MTYLTTLYHIHKLCAGYKNQANVRATEKSYFDSRQVQDKDVPTGSGAYTAWDKAVGREAG